MDNDMMQLRTAQEQLLAAKEAFRRSYRDLSGDQLELAWNRFCSSPGAGVGHPPDLPRTMSWTGYLEGSGLSVRSTIYPTGEDSGLIDCSLWTTRNPLR